MAEPAGPRRARPKRPRERPGAEAALEIALRFLANRPRTRWEVERRLRRAGAEGSVVQATLERLASLGLADDVAFVRWWAEQRDRHGPRGRRMVEAELRRLGVGRDAIEVLRGGTHPETAPGDNALPATEEERARVALERHLRGRAMPTEPKAVQRIGAFLVRRGFDPETVRVTLRSAAGAEIDEE